MRTTVVGVCLVGLALIAVSLVARRRQTVEKEVALDVSRWEDEGGAVPVGFPASAPLTTQ